MPETIFAPAKINLWLRIFAPDETGYHPLDTLFCALELADRITLDRIEGPTTLEVVNAELGPTERNLAWRAADEFFRASGLEGGVAIHLDKRIPAGAGLGGGSSDAAAVLGALNHLHDGVLPQAELAAIAARLGSDVAFFLGGDPLAHATGRGELLQPLPALPRAPVIVLAPSFGIATADAYRWLDEARAYSEPQMLRAVPRDWEAIAAGVANDFEQVVFARYPELARLKSKLLDSGALIALLSGSGSTLFGVYGSEAERDGALATLEGTVRASQAVIISTRSRVVQWQDSGLWLR
jgi:4-diphosphocytidyl-2-C-methyl-D-erythritol kinase